jgi:hypothetical protein
MFYGHVLLVIKASGGFVTLANAFNTHHIGVCYKGPSRIKKP